MTHFRTYEKSPDPHPNPRFRRGRGRRYVPDVVEQVRVMVEGTGLSQADIAAGMGLGATTIFNWTRRHGWVRPAEAERWKPLVAADRAGLRQPLRDGFGRIEVLAGRERARLVAERARIEAAIGEAARLQAEAGRMARLHGRDPAAAPRLLAVADGGRGLVRLSIGPRRTLAARPPDLVAQARELVEHSVLPQAEIAHRIGISRQTLIRWAQAGGWLRPYDAPAPLGGWRPGRGFRAQMEAQRAARERLAEAGRLLDAIEADAPAGIARIVEAYSALEGVRAALRPRARRRETDWPDEGAPAA